MRYEIDKKKFKLEFEKVKMRFTSLEKALTAMGYNSNTPYYQTLEEGTISKKFLSRIRVLSDIYNLGRQASRFMKRDDFIDAFGNE